jgi:hypothetical protein
MYISNLIAIQSGREVPTSDPNFGMRTNQVGFSITGATNLVTVVEACTNLVNPVWSPVGTNTLAGPLAGGSSYFSDPQWTNYPARFFRLRSPRRAGAFETERTMRRNADGHGKREKQARPATSSVSSEYSSWRKSVQNAAQPVTQMSRTPTEESYSRPESDLERIDCK